MAVSKLPSKGLMGSLTKELGMILPGIQKVRSRGLEPPWIAPLVPETSASAISPRAHQLLINDLRMPHHLTPASIWQARKSGFPRTPQFWKSLKPERPARSPQPDWLKIEMAISAYRENLKRCVELRFHKEVPPFRNAVGISDEKSAGQFPWGSR